MTRQEIIKEVVNIILAHAKPERIYLYGSHASGEASKTSDIDIGYDDEKFKETYLLEERVEKLPTLIKIDLKNIAFTEERFKTRVKTTGKVVYSATKELRAEDGLFNFSKAYEKFADIVERKEEFYNEGFGDIYLDLVVKRFEFTYEMSWKTIKRYMDFLGIDCKHPRSCFKEAYAQGVVEEEAIWIEMIEKRNLSRHIYDEREIEEILDRVSDYSRAFGELKSYLEKKIRATKQNQSNT